MLAETKTTAELGEVLKELFVDVQEASIKHQSNRSCILRQDQFPGIEAFKSGPSLALKLYELAEKRKEQHAELWSKARSPDW